jgi:hypothetical protein
VSSFYGLGQLQGLGLEGGGIDPAAASGSDSGCLSCPLITSETAYWIHMVAEDASGNLMAEAALLPWFATPDDTPPEWVTGHGPAVLSNAATIYAHSPNAAGLCTLNQVDP